jgi:polar amino acid transport system substrate-binding protein
MNLSTIKKFALSLTGMAVMLGWCNVAQADRLADVRARGTLICATLTSSEPLGFPDPQSREIVGFDVDMCSAIAREMGVRMQHQGVSVQDRIPELMQGRFDLVVAALGYTRERAQQIDFTASHYQNPIRLIVNSDAGLTKIEDLADKTISANKNSTPEAAVRRVLPRATIITAPDVREAFLALAQGRVQGLALSQPSGIRFTNDSEGKYRFVEGALAWEPTAMGVKKGEPALLAAVNEALEKLEKSGETDMLWSKWFGPKTKYNIRREKKLTPISAFR